VRSLGVPIDPSRFIIAGNGDPIDVFVPDGNAILCVTTAGLIPGVAARGAQICSTHCDYVSKLVNSVESVMDSVTATDQPPAQALQETLIREASDAIQASSVLPAQAGTQSLRAAAVARACRLIDAKLAKAITLTHLSQYCGVGVRTLEYGFRQFYDITPIGFIKSQRLTRTHTALSRVPTQASSINEVARSLGFTHMGQYAKDYRELFGESPSMTLQRALRQTNAQPSHESADQEGPG
jgi:transcriptional regulator GlxA family with amidase domain